MRKENNMDNKELIKELRKITIEAESIGPYLEGNLLKGKFAKYTHKDGVVSKYPTNPVLQYRVGPGKRKSKRIPLEKVDIVERLLVAGIHRRKLMDRHLELSAMIALDFKKNSAD